MPELSKLSKITLPSGTTYDLRDSYAQHYVGITTTALSTGATTNPITIGGNSYTAKENDLVLTSTENEQFLFNGTAWQSLTAVTEAPSDATITIQRNGDTTTEQTFTLNQATNATINIEVPILGISVDGTALTPDSSTKIVDIDSIPAEIIAAGALADGMTATTQTTGDDTTKLATTAFVQQEIAAIPEPMVFKGTVGAQADNPTITALPVDGSAKKGDTYKVITDGTYAGQAAKVGDTFICNGKTSSANTWVLIPSGDEPTGTVTSVAVSAGLTTSNAGNAAITESGTIGLDLKSATPLTEAAGNPSTTTDQVYPVAIDGAGKLAVAVPWENTEYEFDGTYDAATNKAATVSTVTDAINALDGGTISGTAGAGATVTALSQTDGNISATFAPIAITTNQVTDIDSTTKSVTGLADSTIVSVVSNVASAAPAGQQATGEILYVNAVGETLILSKLTKTNASTATTSSLLAKTTT